MVSAMDVAGMALRLVHRAAEEGDPESSDGSQKEIFAAWALFISIMLLIIAFLTSYFLQERKIEAVHETVISIFAGMTVGLLLLVTSGDSIRNLISFDYQIFFNLLLPPIILASGYELHQANFFRNMGTILTFAFAGTFLSAVVIGLILWLYALTGVESISMSFVDAISVGATLSATDPVTILAIFNSYKVDPKLYTIIFGESILNDAIAIVIFETAQKYKKGDASKLGFLSFFEGIGIFLIVFFGSLLIGVLVGVLMALLLKLTYIRRYPKNESCLVVLIAYATYFFSHAIHMSGIVSLLFCGITLKHYAYFNMSRRTQLTTKFIFQILAQLSENFIFIYLGLALFTDNALQFRPLLIIITVCAVCAARWVAVFPLSRLINWVIRYRARRRGGDVSDELPYNYQAMLFWAGLRGAVGVALAALLTGENSYALKATVLVVVVLTVIIFGGTTARMLEILGIRTGVVDEIDSDDEFDIETFNGGQYVKRTGTGIGYVPRRNGSLSLDNIGSRNGTRPPVGGERSSYVSGSHSPNPIKRQASLSRKNSEIERADLLGRSGNTTDSDLESDIDTSDLPPPARREPRRRSPTIPGASQSSATSGGLLAQTEPTAAVAAAPHHVSATSAIRQLFSHGAEDAAGLFRQLDEDYIKPKLLLDGGSNSRGNGSGPGPGQV
ncbi:cpa1 family monovalent cation:h+ antiporter [Colletotrichum incanum]|uniref:Sodium/hydrogen exchanger n=1 Tax=Colletotrichum incanum TaxID=1573173 RepID=A0A162N660_COLIC|nr:cpa1 family monovalent cation:h+ antiporter [Colletotrichum incanum]OHW93589.1 cpa1 family monovalent cation:h+ antiporter [Colletotrichum incanum]